MATGVKVGRGRGAASARDGVPARDGDPLDADVTGAAVPSDAQGAPEATAATDEDRPPAAPRAGRGRRSRARRAWAVVVATLAVLGIAGTVGFGMAWAGLRSRQDGETQARAAARSFLVDLTNFDAKTVDADFSAVTAMATGPFAAQAAKFFNSSIRQDLEKALASSRGQIRALLVQSYGDGQATVYGVVDQLYVNAKLSTPRTDVLRLVVTMSEVQARWKVADVTVLQGPSPTASGSGAKS
jgi:hypothetical protein